MEEHDVIVGEPRELYLTYFSVENGKGVTVGKAIYKKLENTDLQNSLSIVGPDGTAIRTGNHHAALPFWNSCFKDLGNGSYVSCTPTNYLSGISKHLDGVS